MDNITHDDVIQTIQQLARNVFADPNLQLSDEMCPANLPAWTSLTYTQLLTKIEVAYNIKFKITDIIKMQNMGAIINATLERVSECINV